MCILVIVTMLIIQAYLHKEKPPSLILTIESEKVPITGITLAQNFQATSCLPPGDLELRLNKQSDSRLHVAAVLTVFSVIKLFAFGFIVA